MTSIHLSEQLFSYGTLQMEEVQVSTFGRLLEGRADSLPGYTTSFVPIADAAVAAALGSTHYQNICFTGNETDVIRGMVFSVTKEELELADDYEIDADYRRIVVQLGSGTNAWVYLRK